MRNRGNDYSMLRKRARKLIENDKKFIEELTAIRESKGLDRIEFAWRMGVTVNYLVDLELGGVDPTLGDIRRYAHALGVIVEHNIIPDDVQKS